MRPAMFEMRTTYKIGWCMRSSAIEPNKTSQCMEEHERGVGALLQKVRNAGHTVIGITSIKVGQTLKNASSYAIMTVIYHEIAEHAKVCKKCGTPNLATAKFCMQCGTDIELKH